MSPTPKPSDPEPSTYFEIEQRRLDNPGEAKVGADVSSLPPQGPTSGMDCRPGGNGREILKSGSQAKTPPARPLPRGEPEF
jgi:hypothetical protein